MANITDIERLNYYEGEYLGAVDFEAEQEYHRDTRRRHNVGQHTWGIVGGLSLAQIQNGAGAGQVDVSLMPGMAIDAFGREIVVLSNAQITQDLFAPYYDANSAAVPKLMYLWIVYDEQMAKASAQACSTSTTNAFGRVVESYRLVVTPTAASPANDTLLVDGISLSPPIPGPSTPPPPAPGEIVLPYDGSVPFQEFVTDTILTWHVPIGRLLWHPHLGVFLQLDSASAASGRLYCGSVASTIYAPEGALTLVDREAPYPLPTDSNDANYGGISAEVAGSLQVDRLLNPLIDTLIGQKYSPADTVPLSPLTIAAQGTDEELIQFRTGFGQRMWHISQNPGGKHRGINFGEYSLGNPVEARLFIQATVTGAAGPSPRNVGIGTMTPRSPLSIRGQGNWEEVVAFEDAAGNTKWHINHNPIGNFSGATIIRGLNFCETGVQDYRFFLQTGGKVGVGTPVPQQNLSVNVGLNIDQANVNSGQLNPGPALTFGSNSGEGMASRRVAGANQFGLDFFTEFAIRLSITQAGLVGIGTGSPLAQLHISGGQWDLAATSGDLTIGSPTMALKFGVALGGAGAGDARIRAQGGTSRLMLGGATSDTLTITSDRVGINTISPDSSLHVAGNSHIAGNLLVQGNVTITGSMSVSGSKSGYVADRFVYRGATPLERGDVVVLHHTVGKNQLAAGRIPVVEVALSRKAGDTQICGIVDEPILGPEQIADLDTAHAGKASIGLMVTLGAYAFCKVDASSGAIAAGDLLTTSASPGYAQKLDARAKDKLGAIIGKALRHCAQGQAVIPVFVSHQ
jgi:hypothetical protein